MSRWGYGYQLTTECDKHGSGQCDGYQYEGRGRGTFCGCPCHDERLPDTIEGVKAWHDTLHGVNDSIGEGLYDDEADEAVVRAMALIQDGMSVGEAILAVVEVDEATVTTVTVGYDNNDDRL